MSAEIPQVQDRRLLVVDDDALVLRSLRRVFELEGWRVYPATGVHDAMRVMNRFHPEVALVDVCMPQGGALGYFAQAQAQHLEIPTVLMSGAPQVRAVIEQKLKGAVRFIDKPLDFEVAREALLAALNTANAEPEVEAPKPPEAPIADQIQLRLQRATKHVKELPVLDPTLAAALPLFKQESTRTDAVVRILGRDLATSAAVMRTANSGFFKASRPIEKLEDACVRMGMRGVAMVVYDVAVVRAFEIRAPALSMISKRMWENATTTAHLATTFARKIPNLGLDPGEAYIAGLLHNVGEAAALHTLDNTLSPDAKRELTEDLIRKPVATYHEAIGSTLFRSWGLPSSLISLTGKHHGEPGDPGSMREVVRCAWEIACRTRAPYAFGVDLPLIAAYANRNADADDDDDAKDRPDPAIHAYAERMNTSEASLRVALDVAFSVD